MYLSDEHVLVNVLQTSLNSIDDVENVVGGFHGVKALALNRDECVLVKYLELYLQGNLQVVSMTLQQGIGSFEEVSGATIVVSIVIVSELAWNCLAIEVSVITFSTFIWNQPSILLQVPNIHILRSFILAHGIE